MSMTDYRQLIDIHGGHYIGIEVVDGLTAEVAIDGTPYKLTLEHLGQLIDSVLEKMRDLLADGFKKFTLTIGGSSIDLNYYDAGVLLDALRGAVNYLR